MSDYMFMLENHLSADQNRVVAELQAAAGQANLNVFLTGGAMRDMLGGYQVRDLDFSVEGNSLKIAKTLAQKAGARTLSVDENRRAAELLFPGGVTAQVAMSRVERYAKIGGRPQVAPATIQEDLRGRDFSVNAIALSLNRASRGLLLDPTNGLADLGRRELRMLSTYTFYDDPSRLFRLVRLCHRLAFTVEERTKLHYDSARSGHLETYIPRRMLFEELKHIAGEPNPGEVVRALEQDGLLAVMCPALSGAKLNVPTLMKLEKLDRLMPSTNGTNFDKLGPFLCALTEKLTAREKAVLIKNTEMRKAEVELWQKLEGRARKLERALNSSRVGKPSQIYQILSQARRDEVMYLLVHSQHRLVQERIRNYLQKYLPRVQEVAETELGAIDAKPGTAKYEKAKEELLALRLDHPTRRKAAPVPPAVPLGTTAREGR